MVINRLCLHGNWQQHTLFIYRCPLFFSHFVSKSPLLGLDFLSLPGKIWVVLLVMLWNGIGALHCGGVSGNHLVNTCSEFTVSCSEPVYSGPYISVWGIRDLLHHTAGTDWVCWFYRTPCRRLESLGTKWLHAWLPSEKHELIVGAISHQGGSEK